jgi:uncharacterized protein involved in exopolysaccharide biosynthesis
MNKPVASKQADPTTAVSEAALTSLRLPPGALRIGLLWLALLALPTLVGATLAYFGATLTPAVYAARAEIVFSLPQVAAVPEQYRATQVVVAASHSVLGPVAASLKVPEETVARNFTADFPKDGALLRLQFADRNPDAALQTLEAILDQYLVVLDDIGNLDAANYRLLTAPFLIDRPIWPQPLMLAAIGAAIGLAIALAAGAAALQFRLIA